jgi:hypothetical protein
MAAVYSLEGAGEVREVFIKPQASSGAETTAAIFGCLESTRERTASDDARLTGKKSLIPVLASFSERSHLSIAITEDPVRSLRAKRHSSMSLEVAIVADVFGEKSLLS